MKRIGLYELGEILGEGGMGTVYRGRDPRFDRLVAIKVLHPHLARQEEVSERFRTEAIVQAKLSHPHIVTVHDFIAEGETLAMVLELLTGQTLEELIRTRPESVRLEDACLLMEQVLAAVGHAHNQGVVHRDLKPSNIMVEVVADRFFAKVVDFGIAKILGSSKMRTATGAKMGTLVYMSPEHLNSPKDVDRRSDIYALGATFYELLAGRVPFEGDTEFNLMKAIVEQPPSKNRLQQAGVSQPLIDVLLKALMKDPGARFATCVDFSRAVKGAKAQQVSLPTASTSPAADPNSGFGFGLTSFEDVPNGSLTSRTEGIGAVRRESTVQDPVSTEVIDPVSRSERAESSSRNSRLGGASTPILPVEAEMRGPVFSREWFGNLWHRNWAIGAGICLVGLSLFLGLREDSETVELDSIFDPTSKIHWTKTDNGLGVTWFDAQRYCAHLESTPATSWRMASIEELREIYDESKSDDCTTTWKREKGGSYQCHPSLGIDLTGPWVWSSTRVGSSRAFGFDFRDGELLRNLISTDDGARVLCVRGAER